MANSSAQTLLLIVATGEASTDGVSSSQTLTLITASGTASSPNAASAQTLPLIVAGGTALSGKLVLSVATLPTITAAGTAITDSIGVSNQTLPSKTAHGAAFVNSYGTSSLTLPLIQASGTATTNSIGTSAATLPGIIAAGIAYQVGVGQVTTTENPYNDPQVAWAINYQTNAPYRYYRFPANSMCRFKGKTYVANAGGIYEVTGETDAGQDIDSQITLPKSDFSNSHDKRIPYVYAGLRSSGTMQLRVTANAEAGRYYALNTGPDYVRGSRADVGKGLKAKYWQLAIANREGAYFELDSVEFSPILLSRHGV